MDDLTGKQLGPYRIVEALGEGGMAMVYKAYQASMDRYVAIKIMHQFFARDEEFRARFQQEARLIGRLEHPHIVPIFDFGSTQEYTYIAMRYIDGQTLADLVGFQPLPLAQTQKVITQVGSALEYAHVRGVIHRDVKPSNILLDQDGNCFLSDFGFAKFAESQVQLSLTGSAIGTPMYMSPEQIMGQPLDGRSDIYALGIVLYEMATGRTPYKSETPTAMFVKHIHDRLPPPRQFNPDIPEQIERVIFKALAKDPNDRFVSMGELVRAMGSSPDAHTLPPISHAPLAPPPAPPPGKLSSMLRQLPTGRSLRIMIGLALSTLLFVGLAASALMYSSTVFGARPEDPATATATTEAPPSPTATPMPPTATITQTPTVTPTPDMTATTLAEATETPTTVIASTGTVVFRECRGIEGTLMFASFPAESLHQRSELTYTIAAGNYSLQVTWPNNPDLNVSTTITVHGGRQVIAFGDQC